MDYSNDLGKCEPFRRVAQRFKYSPLCPECNNRINFISDYCTHRVLYHNVNHNKVYDELVCILKDQNLWDECTETYDPCGGRYYKPYVARSGYCNVCCNNPCHCNSWYGWRDICSNYPPYRCDICHSLPAACCCRPHYTIKDTLPPNWTLTLPELCDCENDISMKAGQDLEKGDRVKIRGNKVYKDNSVIICHSFYCEYCKRHSSRFKNIKLSWPNGTNGFDCNYCGRWNYLSDYERDQIANSMRSSK